jgi:hypothetical protein
LTLATPQKPLNFFVPRNQRKTLQTRFTASAFGSLGTTIEKGSNTAPHLILGSISPSEPLFFFFPHPFFLKPPPNEGLGSASWHKQRACELFFFEFFDLAVLFSMMLAECICNAAFRPGISFDDLQDGSRKCCWETFFHATDNEHTNDAELREFSTRARLSTLRFLLACVICRNYRSSPLFSDVLLGVEVGPVVIPLGDVWVEVEKLLDIARLPQIWKDRLNMLKPHFRPYDAEVAIKMLVRPFKVVTAGLRANDLDGHDLEGCFFVKDFGRGHLHRAGIFCLEPEVFPAEFLRDQDWNFLLKHDIFSISKCGSSVPYCLLCCSEIRCRLPVCVEARYVFQRRVDFDVAFADPFCWWGHRLVGPGGRSRHHPQWLNFGVFPIEGIRSVLAEVCGGALNQLREGPHGMLHSSRSEGGTRSVLFEEFYVKLYRRWFVPSESSSKYAFGLSEIEYWFVFAVGFFVLGLALPSYKWFLFLASTGPGIAFYAWKKKFRWFPLSCTGLFLVRLLPGNLAPLVVVSSFIFLSLAAFPLQSMTTWANFIDLGLDVSKTMWSHFGTSAWSREEFLRLFPSAADNVAGREHDFWAPSVNVEVDFVADVGDGFASTKKVADQVVKDGSSIVIFGGDMSYPKFGHPYAAKRFFEVYRDSILQSWTRYRPVYKTAFFTLGNHDFFNECESFRQLISQGSEDNERRSFCSWDIGNVVGSPSFLRFIGHWWIVGVSFSPTDDLHAVEVKIIKRRLREELKALQVERMFQDATGSDDKKKAKLDDFYSKSRNLSDRDFQFLPNFVLICHRPFWLLDGFDNPTQPNLNKLIAVLRQFGKLRLILAGDLHNFSHSKRFQEVCPLFFFLQYF